MKKLLLLSFSALVANFSFTQTKWHEDAAEVFFNNCTECHNPEGIGPNSLMTYNEAVNYGPLIESYIENNVMPPWTADSSFQHYAQERLLSQYERDVILNWISDGMLEGDVAQAPPTPVYNGAQILSGVPDLTVVAPNYMSKATANSDDYVCFTIPTGLLSNKKVRAFEVIPGNRQTVHHALVYHDANASTTTDTSGNCAGPVSSELMGGYTPGATPTVFPATGAFSTGMILDAGANIVIAMHYPAGSYGEFDQTSVNFYFYDEPVANFRPVSCDPIIQDWGFTIPAATFDSVEVATGGLPADYTMLSVFPHMHLLGHYIDAWGVTPLNDTLNFAKIPQWDFDWQDFYWFEYMQKIPAGTSVHGKGVYNNTVTNSHNPNNPPLDVSAGLNTSDEMFLIYFHYMDYQAGDEYINVDSLTTEFLSDGGVLAEEHSFIQTYPNPFDQSTTILYSLNQAATVSLYIYDMQGRVVNKLVDRENQPEGTSQVQWNGTNTMGIEVPVGVYFYSIMVDGVPFSGKIVKK
jgi:hypothetical protein